MENEKFRYNLCHEEQFRGILSKIVISTTETSSETDCSNVNIRSRS